MESNGAQIDSNSILQELRRLFDRATTTSSDDVDLLAIDLFASLVSQYESSIVYEATKIIADKFKSTNSEEILLALNVLEECMSKCGIKFHSEIGKFRFLNELIRLVSPRYLGDKTPKRIRDKILDLMLLWTVSYTKETKIKEAYDMLLKQGVNHEFAKTVTVAPKPDMVDMKSLPERPSPQPDIAEKLKKLLQSSKATDHKAANLLIQNMVKEKERRTEVHARRKLQVKEIIESAGLLNEMLDQNIADGKNLFTDDELTTLNDLHSVCIKMQPTITILVADLNDSNLLEEALEANDLLMETLKKYSKIVLKQSNGDGYSSERNTYLKSNQNQHTTVHQNAFDDLKEIFSANSASPVSLNTEVLLPKIAPIITCTKEILPKNNNQDILFLTHDLLNDAPSTSAIAFSSSSSDPFNLFKELKSETKIEKESLSAPAKPTHSKLANFDSEMTELVSGLKINMKKENTETVNVNVDDDKMLDLDGPNEMLSSNETITDTVQIEKIQSKNDVVEHIDKLVKTNNENVVLKPLRDLFVDLNNIEPHKMFQSQCILNEPNGLKIVLNFVNDKPRDDVAVLVLTTTNYNSQPILNYQIEASVSKPCKVHLQKASGHELPGVKPFRPPSEDITQLMLLSNAEKKKCNIMCIVSYVLADDPDPVKEFLEINDLPDLF